MMLLKIAMPKAVYIVVWEYQEGEIIQTKFRDGSQFTSCRMWDKAPNFSRKRRKCRTGGHPAWDSRLVWHADVSC